MTYPTHAFAIAAALLALAGCSAAGDAPAGAIEVSVDAEANEPPPPLAAQPWEQFEVTPAPEQYHGGHADEWYGMGRADGPRAMQDGGDVTWSVSGATDVQRAAAVAVFEHLAEVLPSWSFVEQATPDRRTDIVVKFSANADVPAACTGAPGTCWLGSTKCAGRVGVDTGVDNRYACEQFKVGIAAGNVEAAIVTWGLHPELTWRALVLHEVGHALGLRHAPDASASIMRAMMPAPGVDDIATAVFSERELCRLESYSPIPGAWYPLQLTEGC